VDEGRRRGARRQATNGAGAAPSGAPIDGSAQVRGPRIAPDGTRTRPGMIGMIGMIQMRGRNG
jgi:hypothetical protein